MFRIAKRQQLNEQVVLMEVEAPLIAKAARPGQFIICGWTNSGNASPLPLRITMPHAAPLR